jgi:predicted porin
VNVTALCDYWLSKSVDVYTSATWLHASGGAAPVFLGGGSAPVFENGVYVGSGDTSVAVRVGLRKLF